MKILVHILVEVVEVVAVVTEEEIDVHAVGAEAGHPEGVERVHLVQDLVHEVVVNEEVHQQVLYDALTLQENLLAQENQVQVGQDLGLDRDHRGEEVERIKPLVHVSSIKVLHLS